MLEHLRVRGDCTVRELFKCYYDLTDDGVLGATRGHFNTLLIEMHDRGFINLPTSDDDRRLLGDEIVVLTAEGAKFLLLSV